jgi:hypothetical protein
MKPSWQEEHNRMTYENLDKESIIAVAVFIFISMIVGYFVLNYYIPETSWKLKVLFSIVCSLTIYGAVLADFVGIVTLIIWILSLFNR